MESNAGLLRLNICYRFIVSPELQTQDSAAFDWRQTKNSRGYFAEIYSIEETRTANLGLAIAWLKGITIGYKSISAVVPA